MGSSTGRLLSAMLAVERGKSKIIVMRAKSEKRIL